MLLQAAILILLIVGTSLFLIFRERKLYGESKNALVVISVASGAILAIVILIGYAFIKFFK